MRTDVRNAGSPKLARMMVDKAALEIDRLPVLNVDEDVIAYGAGVSETFRNMRNLSKNASLDASYRQASMAGKQGYGDGGFYGGGTYLSLSTSVMRKQKTAVLKSNQMAVITIQSLWARRLATSSASAHHAFMNQKIIPMSPTRWLVNGVGSPARKYQSFPRCVRMPGVNTTLVWLPLAKGGVHDRGKVAGEVAE